jgi:Predicted thioesterase involved in non-ribosomal peptide biosynthesis
VKLLEKYKNIRSEPLDCPISVIGGKSDPAISKNMLSGWQSHTSAVFIQHEFPGEHFFINSERNSVIETILNDLARKD